MMDYRNKCGNDKEKTPSRHRLPHQILRFVPEPIIQHLLRQYDIATSMHQIIAVLLVVFIVCTTPATAETSIDLNTTARLVRAAEKSVADPQGWAFDLLDVLQLHGLPQSRENVCAAIAIIDQESSFNADPVVPGLGKLSEMALQEKLAKVPIGGTIALKWLANTPNPQTSFLKRIRNAKSERDLDLAYRALVDYGSRSASLDAVVRLGLLNTLIEDKNEIDTAGSMQVSVKFALDMARQRRWLPMTLDDVYGVRDQLYTRHGGMYYGVKQLLGYDTGYNRKIFRFADFNAGRFASRNAAFQQVVAKLSGQKLSVDGDLLSYSKDGNVRKIVTSSEKAIRLASQKQNLGLSDADIRRDLLQEKNIDFVKTRTFTALRERYASTTKSAAAFARLPDIALNSPKLKRSFTTRRFAESVNTRYQACMKQK